MGNCYQINHFVNDTNFNTQNRGLNIFIYFLCQNCVPFNLRMLLQFKLKKIVTRKSNSPYQCTILKNYSWSRSSSVFLMFKRHNKKPVCSALYLSSVFCSAVHDILSECIFFILIDVQMIEKFKTSLKCATFLLECVMKKQ